MALSAAGAAVAVAQTVLAQGLGAVWSVAVLVCTFGAIGFVVHRTWSDGRPGVRLAREGTDWFVASLPVAAPDRNDGASGGPRDVDEPLALLAPAYRSSWLVVLRLRDPAGRTSVVDVHADAVCPRAFSYLHLACLFDIEERGVDTGAAVGRTEALRYTDRRSTAGERRA